MVIPFSNILAETKLIGLSQYFETFEMLSEKAYKIYAGNTFNSCSGDGTAPCDSCALAIPIDGSHALPRGLACNDKQIYPSLEFVVRLSSSVKENYIGTCSSSLIIAKHGTTVIQPRSLSTFQNQIENQEITAVWTWGDLCQTLGQSATCESSFLEMINIGFNSNCENSNIVDGGIQVQVAFRYVGNSPPMTFGCGPTEAPLTAPFEAFCDFGVYPGDEKVYITQDAANISNSFKAGDQTSAGLGGSAGQATTADPSQIKYSKIRMYYSNTGGFSTLTTASAAYDISINLDGGIADRRIKSLNNNQTYIFLGANKDQAGNVELFSDPSYGGNYYLMSEALAPVGETQSAQPEAVIGLLDDQRCFIATAAFGNSEDPQVKILRVFRDKFLISNKLGQHLVSSYYKYSPYFAKKIATSPLVRAIVRFALWPFVGASQLLIMGQEYFIKNTIVSQSSYDNQEENSRNFELDGGAGFESSLDQNLESQNDLDSSANSDSQENDTTFETQDLNEANNDEQLTTEKVTSSTLESSNNEENKELSSIEVISSEKIDFVETTWPSEEAFEKARNEQESGKKFIEHPLSEKGLVKIKSDGSYQYKVDIKKRTRSAHVGLMPLNRFLVRGSRVDYQSMYSNTSPWLLYGGVEWIPFLDSKNYSFRSSFGLGSLNGQGTLSQSGLVAAEKYTLFIVPLSFQGLYRLDYSSRQWIAPYLLGGLGYLGLSEIRDDSKKINFAGAMFVEAGVGLQLSLLRLSQESMFVLQRDYNLADLWLSIEGKYIQGFKNSIDINQFTFVSSLILDF